MRIINHRYQQVSFTQSQQNLLFLCLEIIGVVRVKLSSNSPERQTVWVTDASQKEVARVAEQQISRIFKAQVTSIPLDEVVVRIRKNLGQQSIEVPVDLIEDVLNICDIVECGDGKTYRTAFERLPSHALRAHRVLHEKGEPLPIHELVNEINHLIVSGGGHNLATDVSVASQLSLYNEVVAEGKSRWKLKEWGGETRPIVKVMEEFFHLHNQPAHPDAVYDYVRARRQVKRNSILAYLSMDNTFHRVGPHEYVLASWRHPSNHIKQPRRRVAQADFDSALHQIFMTSQATNLPLPVVVANLRKRFSCGDMSARSHVKASHVVRLVLKSNATHYYVCLRNPQNDVITHAPITTIPKPRTQLATVHDEALKILRDAPMTGLKSAVFVKKIIQNTRLPRSIVYAALGKLKGSVERTVGTEGVNYKLQG